MNIAALFNNTPLYPLIATGLVHIVLLVSYLQKADTDRFQRKLYLSVLLSMSGSIVTNFTGSILQDKPGAVIYVILYITYTLYFLLQQFSYYQMTVFIDYIAVKNSSRTIKFTRIVLIIMTVNFIIIMLNIFSGFYFSVDANNHYVNGPYYLVRFYLGYSAILVAIVDLFLAAKFMGKGQLHLIVVTAVLMGSGIALDLLIPGENFVWMFFTVAMLRIYFEIIRADTTQDAISGIGNRSSFSEFVNQLSHMNTKQSYNMVQFDINGLKKINSEHGTEAGDMALADMGMILKTCSRQSDFIARIGADEFIVAIKVKFDIERLISRILRTLEKHNQEAGRPYTLSISYGYATFATKTDQLIEEFLHHLNGLVFQHKNAQRNEGSEGQA